MAEPPDGSSPLDDVEEDTVGPSAVGGPGSDWTFAAQAHYDPAEPRDLTTVVVGAIAEAEGVPMAEITEPPLYDAVDVAGIDGALFGRPDVERNGTESTVEFRYDEYKMSIEADGWVSVFRSAEGPTTE